MIRDITLGQYFPGESGIHKLDPRVKIILCLVYLVALFLVKDFIGFLFAILTLACVIAVSKVPVNYILKGLKPIFLIIIFTFTINMFMIGGEVLWQWGVLHITKEGLYTGPLSLPNCGVVQRASDLKGSASSRVVKDERSKD